MWLQLRMFLLLAGMFAILYTIIVVLASMAGIGNFLFFGVLAVAMLLVQYLISPKIVEMSMKVDYVGEEEAPRLHRMVEELSTQAGIPKPRVGISQLNIPNAFAFGRSKKDGRVCVTGRIMELLSEEELRAVLGHEVSHIKNRDMTTITIMSVVPMVLWFAAWSFMFSGGRDRGNTVALGIVAFILYFVTNLLVLYGSRIREYYADQDSVKLGNPPHALASALYKLVYGSARVDKKELKQMEGYKAFFASDPSRARGEIQELSQVDADMSGSIEEEELTAMRDRKINISTSDKVMELLSTHPNMVSRVKRLGKLYPLYS